jgi:hypothetical protein
MKAGTEERVATIAKPTAKPAAKPVQSPARQLNKKVARAFSNGNAATAAAGEPENF